MNIRKPLWSLLVTILVSFYALAAEAETMNTDATPPLPDQQPGRTE